LAVQVLDLNLNCQECNDILQRERGCNEKGILPFNLDGKLVYRCPLKQVDSVSWEYIKAYGLYSKNILPHGKGWLVESQKYLDAMAVVSSEVNRMEQDKVKKQGYKHGHNKK